MSTELQPAPAYSREQVDLIKRTICKGASDDEFALFLHVCKRTGLDPLTRQIYALKRRENDNGVWVEKMTFQTGIDGYRLIADRTGRYAPGREPSFAYDAQGRLVSATAYVKKLTGDGHWHEVAATAHFAEYVVLKKDGSPNRMWGEKPHLMLAKCGEALALRRAFPDNLSGVYTAEEMRDAEPVEGEAAPAARETPPPKKAKGLKTLPADGAELERRLLDYDARAAAEGLWPRGALVRHVTEAGVKAGHCADLAKWHGPAIALAAEEAKAFEAARRAAQADDRTEKVRQISELIAEAQGAQALADGAGAEMAEHREWLGESMYRPLLDAYQQRHRALSAASAVGVA